ncbi:MULTISPECIES: zinc ribbon domain-containing protein [unclassified Caballeronia]|uniref:zinc ribbon domain-containing protein n=1 Tax=unclassified Caballeronia TaxID=2646786 RepID=UPI00285C6A69|nr:MULTISPECIES: zinc ribbon domain-containing protein [unclassified Caballeronia]MDR5751307.1 zinc ribbon domain-containing protein [Caballeronia sp. LZ024]MDR5844555.1 zinc ribbon domain-containing protein [Caballeronia sp. LZ031]
MSWRSCDATNLALRLREHGGSRAGRKLASVALRTREWTCPECGKVHDRDKNAAGNLLAAGFRATRSAGARN